VSYLVIPPNSEKASETALDVTVSENQPEPETTQTFEPEHKPYSSSIQDQSVSDTSISVSEDIPLFVEAINVAKPENLLKATVDTSLEIVIETQPTYVLAFVNNECVESRTSN